jgi:hypothetical protein
LKISGETVKRLKNLLSVKALSVLLAIVGASMVTAGVWMISDPAGWIVGGCFAFLFEYRIDMSTTTSGEGRGG